MNNLARIVILVTGLVLLSACGPQTRTDTRKPEVVDHSARGNAGQDTGGNGAATRGLKGQAGVSIGSLDDPSTPLGKKIIYFDYDQSDIKDEYKAIITAHARYLASHPGARVILQGHTDERGSREYNIGLGERRARAVRRMLLLLGVTDGQIKVISYGEERPAQAGHDETAWRRNRRVEIVYTSRQ